MAAGYTSVPDIQASIALYFSLHSSLPVTYEGGFTSLAIPVTSAAQSTPTPSEPQAAASNPSTSAPTAHSPYQTPSSTTSIPASSPTQGSFIVNDSNGSGWARGTHIGVIVSIIIGVFLIIVFSVWYCCGGRAWWSKHHDSHNPNNNGLPLYTVRHGRNTQAGVYRPGEGGGDAPPMYAEVAPPEHQTVAGGMRDANEMQRIEEEAAVVSDGKTPLSEIPFEDVVLERHASESGSSGSSGSSSRNLE